MKHTYHFHAITSTGPDSVSHHDGIFQSDGPITTWDSYQDVKKKIRLADALSDEVKLTICSLTLLVAPQPNSVDTNPES